MGNWGTVESSCCDAKATAFARRRSFLRRVAAGGTLAGAALVLPGCVSAAPDGDTEVVRRLVQLSAQRALDKLSQPEGFWESAVARIELPVLFKRPGPKSGAILKSEPFLKELQHELNRTAAAATGKIRPIAAGAVRSLALSNAGAIIAGGPTAATTHLRDTVGPGLVNAMIPEIQRAMDEASDPVLGKAIAALEDVDTRAAAHALAIEADNAIWYEVGAEEAAIRENPAATGDSVLIAGLRRPAS